MSESFTLSLSSGKEYPYQIVSSKRAKYIRIKLSRRGDLSVTLPSFTNAKLAHEFVKSKRVWIEKNLASMPEKETYHFPEILNLLLLSEVWSVVYDHQEKDVSLTEEDNFTIKITGIREQLTDQEKLTKIINKWCQKKAKTVFNILLQDLAELHGFHYQRLSIRAQKTRWGSCSHQKNINLNCKLLFMPKEVVQYVMIHELCHTIEMNHSSRFWTLVEDCDPQYKQNIKQLKTLSKQIPL